MHGSNEKEAGQRISAQLIKYGVTTESLGADTIWYASKEKQEMGLIFKKTIALHPEMKDSRAGHEAKGEAIVQVAQVARCAGS